MKSPPKMPQRAMVRIWVASLHQKDQRRKYAGLLLYPVSQVSLLRVDSNSIDPPNSPAGKKAPVQQRRPLPAAETGRSCWGCGQQDARAAQGTMQPLGAATRVPFLRGSRNPPAPTKKPQRIKIRCGFVLRYFALLFSLHPPVRAAVQEYCFAQ